MGLANTIQASNLDRSNRSFADDQRRQQNAFYEEMYNKQNAYNSPKAQVKRLIDAGINPNSAFSANGASGLPSSGSSGSVSGTYAPFPVDNPSFSYLEYEQQKEDLRGKRIENDYKAESLELDNATKQLAQQNMMAELANLVKQGRLTDAQSAQVESMLPVLLSKSKSDIALLDSQIKNESARYDQILEQISNLKKQGKNIDEDTNYKSLINELQQSKNRLLGHLYDIGINPDSHGADRLLEFVLDSEVGREIINSLLDKANELFSNSSRDSPLPSLKSLIPGKSKSNNKFGIR